MRPVYKGGNPPYTTKTTFSFAGDNATAIMAVLGLTSAQNVPIQLCLQAWLHLVIGAPLGGTAAQQKTAVKAIKKQTGDLYKEASVPLTQRIGAFCSFCETPLPGLLEVEHRAPKANYPTFAVEWVNFLLACSPCNVAKGNKPPRQEATAWTGLPTPTEVELYDAISLNYVWADLYDLAYRLMRPSLWFEDPNSPSGYSLVPNDVAFNYDNEVVSVNVATRTVTATLYKANPPTSYTENVRVFMLPIVSPYQVVTERTVEQLKLNDAGNASSTYDRRVMNRTVAWFTCLKFFKAVEIAPDPYSKAMCFYLLEMMAASTGFYSVWVEILNAWNPALAAQFALETSTPFFFPGTNITDVP